MMRVTVADRIWIPTKPISELAKSMILSAATVENPAYERAVKERIRGVEKQIELWGMAGDNEGNEYIVLPRGMLNQVVRGLDALEYEWAIDDCRQGGSDDGRLADWRFVGSLRDYQLEAVAALIDAEQGIYEAPTGSGKTMTALGIIESVQVPTLIVVNRSYLAEQWRQRIAKHLPNLRVSIWGGGRKEAFGDVTIGLIQTLSREFAGITSPSESARRYFGMVIFDECHHVTAETYRDVCDRLPAKYRFGLSATPERQKGLLAVAEAHLGPVVIRTDKEMLIENGHVLRPLLVEVPTGFEFGRYRASGINPVTGRWERNNYHELLSALVKDRERASLVPKAIRAYGKNHLVVSRRVAHLQLIYYEIKKEFPSFADVEMYFVTGTTDEEEREDVFARVGMRSMNRTPMVVLTTLADEALDCPDFDTIHLVYPTTSPAVLTQQIGRIMRPGSNSMSPVVFDYHDKEVPLLSDQFRKRKQMVYLPEGMTSIPTI